MPGTRFMELSFFLEELLGRKVELVTPQSLNKYIGPHILKDAEMWPSNFGLQNRIADELSFVMNATENKDREVVIDRPDLSRAIVRRLEIIGKQATASKGIIPE